MTSSLTPAQTLWLVNYAAKFNRSFPRDITESMFTSIAASLKPSKTFMVDVLRAFENSPIVQAGYISRR